MNYMKKKKKCDKQHRTIAEIGKCKECSKSLQKKFNIQIKVN